MLLNVFAAVRQSLPDIRLVQIGGRWTPEQEEQLRLLGIGHSVRQVSGLGREQLAAFYRRAAVVLQPSETEGFGLPVIEALACGAIVVASDIPPLREVGSGAAIYCPVADVLAWSETVAGLLKRPETAPGRETRLAQAARYTWAGQAQRIAASYLKLLEQCYGTGSMV